VGIYEEHETVALAVIIEGEILCEVRRWLDEEDVRW
jgi:hypothetical protein